VVEDEVILAIWRCGNVYVRSGVVDVHYVVNYFGTFLTICLLKRLLAF
jgi:hypothetical protein